MLSQEIKKFASINSLSIFSGGIGFPNSFLVYEYTPKFKQACYNNGFNPFVSTQGIRELMLGAKDIDLVLLTHLHFDHSGGCTKIDRTGKAIPAFPRAKYFVQQDCWDAANHPGPGAYAHYWPLQST